MWHEESNYISVIWNMRTGSPTTYGRYMGYENWESNLHMRCTEYVNWESNYIRVIRGMRFGILITHALYGA